MFDVLLGDGRAGEALASPPFKLSCLSETEDVFLGVKLPSGPPPCLEEGNLIRDGLSPEFAVWFVDDETDIRDREGRRSLDTGCDRNSLPAWPEEDRDGDREYVEALDGVRDGERIGLAPLKKLDCRLTDAGDGGICDRVSIVRSDKEGRSPRARPRASSGSATSASPVIGLTSTGICLGSKSSWGSIPLPGSSPMGFAGDEYRGADFLSSDS